ncbi:MULTISPECIES: 30S ribosomal protein S20 [Nitrosomonas]|uniref:Small ribosomal subunit protein bS20 n=1 Tax=Nitrosomonas europaea (strain ATCC 19718 / CIP 103999 / KCTC 2705 / NBRC 14298) TaxID=228410 RepID=RS20_NITEU|nr:MULTISPECIES: 30S ribosomal protein S20 [Nitrosomonas]Q82SI6.1 RecName: Full=Small ribosomal subunit protein bS20; AltName: Full=30S ribosomal protein S20 [Nitrosomonas europaea ATCC 19718]CAD86252.1 Ribosomal protein S20 [Nitrosomonas europaea ATCC 19718]SDW22650.1 SSU ribosomal protein S20P [Nitrosomonas europaea]SES83250.1 SSU ribosomal protein S20P [Nitrosomonas europaea]SJZ96539.1 SSU ribosomal protein S20P [Nitrosomonas europaea]HBF26014.1 30S ribosomal protein S20 [Nitrosomonas sp.]
MANTAQAKKRVRQTATRRERNFGLRSKLRTAIKGVRKAVAAGDKNVAEVVFRKAVSVIDSVASKGIIHKNKASRHKSRLSGAVKAMG